MKCKQCGKEIEGIMRKGSSLCIICKSKYKSKTERLHERLYDKRDEYSMLGRFVVLEGRIRELEEKWEAVEKWAKDRFSGLDSEN